MKSKILIIAVFLFTITLKAQTKSWGDSKIKIGTIPAVTDFYSILVPSATGLVQHITYINFFAKLHQDLLDAGLGGGGSALTFSLPLSETGDVVSMTQAGLAQNGWLSSADFNTFNNKISFPGFTNLLTDYSFIDNSTNWNTAFSWGDHSLVGYLASFTETDPLSWKTTGTTVVTAPTIQGDVTINGTTTFSSSKRSNILLNNNSEVGVNRIGSVDMPNDHSLEFGVSGGGTGNVGGAKIRFWGSLYPNTTPSEMAFITNSLERFRVDINGKVTIPQILQVDTDPTTGDHVGNQDYNDSRYVQPSTVSVSGGINAAGSGGASIEIQGHELLRAPILADITTSQSITPYATTGWSNSNNINKCDSATDITITLEQHPAFTTRVYQEHFIQKGAGNIIFTAGTGVTILTSGTTPKTIDVGSAVTVLWLSTTEVLITGRLD